MSIIIRLFFNNSVEDIPLYRFNKYSIGSKTVNGYNIFGSDMLAEHISFSKRGEMWQFSCNGEVYFNKEVIKDGFLAVGQIYILSKQYNVSMLVLEEISLPCNTIDISSCVEISFGKLNDNNVVFDNSFISRRHFTVSKRQNLFFVYDNNSTNGVFVNGKKINSCELQENDEIVVGAFKVKYSNSHLYIYGSARDISLNNTFSSETRNNIFSEKILFKRSPRLKLDIPTGTIEIQSPPTIGQKPEMNWLSVLLPTLGTITISIAIAMSTMMVRSTSMLAFTIPTTIIGLVVSITNYFSQKNKHSEKEQLRIDKYTEHLNSVVKEIEKNQNIQRKALVTASPETSECFDVVRNVERRLWERRPSDSDFLDIRVGSGSMPFSMDIKFQGNSISLEEDELKNKPQKIYDKYKNVANMPITCPLLNVSTCGIVGNRNDALKLINNMIAQVATHHCYTEVKTVIIYDEQETKELDWITAIPHCYDDEKKNCFIAKNKDEATELFNKLEKVFKERLQDSEEDTYGITTLKLPYFLFVISAPKFIERETIQRFLLKNDIQLGVGTIFLFDRIELLPQQCNMIIEVKNSEGRIYHKEKASEKKKFIIDRTSAQEFHWFSDRLKNIYCEEISITSTITDKITLFEVLGISSVADLDLTERWENAQVTKSLAAPLGVKEKNELVYLNLHENAHGPHGLVAGTTGSGKSEILQSYILSIATLYHPYEVSFFIIDFKGGGMANQFSNLPHLNGAITDLENNVNAEKEIKRSLLSIKAELDRRKRLFEQANVNKIEKYIDLYKKSEVPTPLPHLIIIVDEFAELKAQQPDFMNDLISAARIGRSLGVHLILATQKPSGQVSEQIWTNSKFKLCLKVADANDSNDMLKSPVAAKITIPGRAYLKVDNSLELFQSGYSGASVYNIHDPQYTELTAIVDYVNDYCIKNNIAKLPSICLPMLNYVIPYNSGKIKSKVFETKIPFGIYDNPAAQIQDYAYIDISQNTFVIGSVRMGKTNLLQSVIRTLSLAYTPEELNMYIMDFGSMTLKTFESLHHVGGVVLPDDDEKLRNLLKMLSSEIEMRKKKTISVGVSSYSAYLEGGYRDMPRIVVLLDNFYGFKEMYEDTYESAFADICKNGVSYGISVIVTNSQSGGFSYKYLKSFADRIAFFCNDSSEYYNLFSNHKISVDNIPGRAIYENANNIVEVQTFLAFEGEREIERTAAAKLHIENVNSLYTDVKAKAIPYVPDVLDFEYIRKHSSFVFEKYNYPLGMDYDEIDVVTLDLTSLGELPIVGKNAKKNKLIMSNIFTWIKNSSVHEPINIHILDSIDRTYMSSANEISAKTYSVDYCDAESIIDEVYDEANIRYENLKEIGLSEIETLPLIFVVINNPDAIEFISSTKTVLDKYKNLMKIINGLKIMFLFGNVDNITAGYGVPELFKRFKENKKGIITEDAKNIKLFDILGSDTRGIKALQNNDALYYDGIKLRRIKLTKED